MHDFNAGLVYGVAEIPTEISAPMCVQHTALDLVLDMERFRRIVCVTLLKTLQILYITIF